MYSEVRDGVASDLRHHELDRRCGGCIFDRRRGSSLADSPSETR
jgi:hypothetical protein